MNLCIYSRVAADVEMTPYFQEQFGSEEPGYSVGHSSIMLVETIDGVLEKTTWGLWPLDYCADERTAGDIATNCAGDAWTEFYFPYVRSVQS